MRQTTKLAIGGKEFLMQELRVADYERLDEYVQGRFISSARASLADVSPESRAWRDTMILAMREAMLLTWSRQPGLGLLLASKRGLARMLHAGMDSGIALDDVADALKTVEDLRFAREEFMRINDLTSAATKEAAANASRPTTSEQGG